MTATDGTTVAALGLVEAIEAQADARPDAVAVVGPERSVTYRQLDQTADAAAAVLRSSDAQAPLALLFAHDVDLVVAVVAALKADRPFLVLDPQSPVEILRAVLDDSEAPTVVHDDANSELASTLPLPSQPWSELTAVPAERVASDRTRSTLAMLAYTSGTSGSPKAAMIPHGALAHLMRGATDALEITSEDRMPMLFPLSLAVAAYPMLLPLYNGASLHVYDMRTLGLAPFGAWMAEQRISLIYFSPTIARFLEGSTDGMAFPDLRTVVLGGERVDADAVAIIKRVFGDRATVFNGYGTTETGVLTFHRTVDGATYGTAGVPVGRPIPEMGLTLVDEHGLPVGTGEVGDLVVASNHLFQGYWRSPELTDAVLDRDADGTPTYRTGDLGRLVGGELELVGRSDTEVKVRGHRVIPGEVEHALLALDAVRDAVVEARPDAMGTNELVAWVVPDHGQSGAEIRELLVDHVRPPMVPAHVIAIDALPLLPNGKLDRQSLPEPNSQRPASLGRAVAPRDEVEEAILDTWEQVFDIRPLGIHDDIEDLGGQSLDAAWLLVVLESRHGIRLPMSDLIEARTIAGMAEKVRTDRMVPGRRSSITVVTPDQGGRPVLYFVHDLHGTAYSLRHLARRLGRDQPLAGFESPFLDGNKAAFTKLETLALRYVTDLRRHQPEGPYFLAGYSFGGVLAFEMARQLVADGADVPFLGVFDVGPGYRGRHYNPRRPPAKPTLHIPLAPEGAGVGRELRWYGDLALRSPRDFLDNVLVRTRADRYTDELQVRRDLRRRGSIHPARRLWYAWRTHWELASRYDWTARRYPGPLTLFWADESASTDATMGWGDIVAEGLDIVRVDVPHEAFLQEAGVDAIAPELRAALDATIEARSDLIGRSEPFESA